MPAMDGLELCKEVRADPGLETIPFIVMSSESDRKVMREMLHLGASAFLIKPFNIEQLVITAEKLLSDHIQLLMKETQLFKAERNHLITSMSSLIQALEARDPYTRGHSESVAELTLATAKALDFEVQGLEKIELAAKLHDIGKIGVRDDVLLKPGRLTDEEFESIKKHPLLGADILMPIPSMADIIPAVLYHHERLDGTGYPYGIKGKDIPLWARVIAVADVHHALTSDRPYRQAMPRNKAFQIIRESTGSHLCPDCVEAFFRALGVTDTVELPSLSAADESARQRPQVLAGKRFVIAEPDHSLRLALKKAFIEHGAESATMASDGAAAWSAVVNESPDLVVTEWNLPLRSGDELLEKIRFSDKRRDLPVILTTSSKDMNQFQRAMRLEVSDYLIKPFTAESLIGKVSALLNADPKKGRGRSGLDGQSVLQLDRLQREIIESSVPFGEMAAGRYRYAVCKGLTAQKAPLDKNAIDVTCAGFNQQARTAYVKHFVNALDMEFNQRFEDDGAALEGFKPATFIQQITHQTVEQVDDVFRTFATECFSRIPRAECDEKGLESLLKGFHSDMLSRTLRHNARFIEELGLLVKTVTEAEAAARDIQSEQTPPPRYAYADMFGRGLLEPLDLYYRIADARDDLHGDRDPFLRQFCGPLLHVVQHFLVGKEKYNTVNGSLLSAVIRYCSGEDAVCKEKIQEYFTHNKLKEYVIRYLTYFLKILLVEEKREGFVSSINYRIKSHSPESELVFTQGHFNMLVSSWARYVFDNTPDLEEKKTTVKILKKYMPAKVM